MKSISLIGILTLLFSFFSIAQPKLGELAADIALPAMNGEIEKLSDHRGKLVLIDF